MRYMTGRVEKRQDLVGRDFCTPFHHLEFANTTYLRGFEVHRSLDGQRRDVASGVEQEWVVRILVSPKMTK